MSTSDAVRKGDRVREKVIVVTGAGSGIGRATAIELARQGAKVGLLDIRNPLETERQIQNEGGQAMTFECDVCSYKSIEHAITTICDKWGPLDGAANIAGTVDPHVGTEQALFTNTADTEWDRIIAVNLGGVRNCLRAELRHMHPSGGSIVNAGSVSALVGSPYNSAYGASKAAVMNLSVSLAQELGRKNIRVNAIAPGIISTPMAEMVPESMRTSWFQKNALGRPGRPEEAAALFLFLLSDESSFCTGTVYNVDAGRR